jgi:hypothetical protein
MTIPAMNQPGAYMKGKEEFTPRRTKEAKYWHSISIFLPLCPSCPSWFFSSLPFFAFVRLGG